MRRRVAGVAAVVVLAVLSVTACGGDDSNTGAATSGSDDPASSSAAPAGTAATTACALVTIDEVAAITQVEVTADPQPATPTACAYDSPGSGIFYAINLQTLSDDDQKTFDRTVSGHEQGFTVTTVEGIGDGTAAAVEHDVNDTLYARKGNTLVAITVFNAVNDPTAAAKALMKTALDRV
jgi:hypothetical protein